MIISVIDYYCCSNCCYGQPCDFVYSIHYSSIPFLPVPAELDTRTIDVAADFCSQLGSRLLLTCLGGIPDLYPVSSGLTVLDSRCMAQARLTFRCFSPQCVGAGLLQGWAAQRLTDACALNRTPAACSYFPRPCLDLEGQGCMGPVWSAAVRPGKDFDAFHQNIGSRSPSRAATL